MTQHFFVGVDGGATKCIARVEDAHGQLLGTGKAGPANIFHSVEKSWDAVHDALQRALQPLTMSLSDANCQFHVGMGLAGSEFGRAYDAFMRFQHPFTTLVVTSDAHTACLGAHAGADGDIIIAGTGLVAYRQYQGKFNKVSGWGFPHDDEGSGAWIGLQAAKVAFKALDGRRPLSGMAKAVQGHFNHCREDMVSWASAANSTAYATLAPLVIEQGMKGDEDAISILKQAAQAIDHAVTALQTGSKTNAALPCALVGGVASFVEPFLSSALQSRLCTAKATPEAGAVLLVRAHMDKR